MATPQKKSETIKISLNVPKGWWKRLKLQALLDDETATGVLVRLGENYLASKKKKR